MTTKDINRKVNIDTKSKQWREKVKTKFDYERKLSQNSYANIISHFIYMMPFLKHGIKTSVFPLKVEAKYAFKAKQNYNSSFWFKKE